MAKRKSSGGKIFEGKPQLFRNQNLPRKEKGFHVPSQNQSPGW